MPLKSSKERRRWGSQNFQSFSLGGSADREESTLSKRLARHFSGRHESAGSTLRGIAEANGCTLPEIMQRDGIDDVDLQVDFATARMIVENKESPLIIEGRMAAVMASYAIEHLRFPQHPIHRVYLQCDEREVCLRMAEREAGLEAKEWMREVLRSTWDGKEDILSIIAAREDRDDKELILRALRENRGRDAVDQQRLRKLYGAECSYGNLQHYDAVVDTSKTSHDEKFEAVLAALQSRSGNFVFIHLTLTK